MKTKKDPFAWLFIFIFLFTIVWNFYIFVGKEEYVIQYPIDCNPEESSCFVYWCDVEEDGEECDPEEPEYYAYIETKANLIPRCEDDLNIRCPVDVCDEGDLSCSSIWCDIEEEDECANFN